MEGEGTRCLEKDGFFFGTCNPHGGHPPAGVTLASVELH